MKSVHNLYIIGASSFGRELESWLELIPKKMRDWSIAGYFDYFSVNEFLKTPCEYPFLGSEDDFEFGSNDYCIIGVADPKKRELIYNKLKERVKVFTFIAPNAIIGKFSKIGVGSIICPNCIVSTNVTVGTSVIVNIGSQIGHDVIIGNFTSLMASVEIAGNCIIGDGCYFGSKSVLIPARKIGNKVKVGAGSVVLMNIKDNSSVFGNPAEYITF